MTDKLYCGIGRTKDKPWGKQLRISMSRKDVNALCDHLDKGNEWVSLDVHKRKNPNGDQTHYLTIDTWKPEPKQDGPSPVQDNDPTPEADNMPF